MTSSRPSADTPAETPPQKNNKIPGVVYHYTNTASLLSIIQNKKLWATSLRYMNDRLEYSFGIELLAEALKERLKNWQIRTDIDRNIGYGDDPDEPILAADEFHLLMLIEKLEREQSDLAARGLSGAPSSFQVFSTSFCESDDLLSQWRGYAGVDGWAIGFDLEKLVESDETIEAVQVKYGYKDLVEDIPTIVEIICNRIHDPYPNDEPVVEDIASFYSQDWSDKEVIEIPASEKVSYDISNACLKVLSGYKHPAFLEEREWRIIVDEQTARNRWYAHQNAFDPGPTPSWSGLAGSGVKEELDGSTWQPVKFRPGSVALTPYLEISFPKEAIREVVIGPHPHMELQKTALEWFLRQQGLLQQVEVKVSEAPFR